MDMQPKMGAPAQTAPVQPDAWSVPAQMLYQAPGTERPYIEERRAIVDAMSRALDKPAAQWGVSQETVDAMLALARLHYRHGQGPEGLSVLEGLDRANVNGTQRFRRAVMELALGLIDPRETGLTEAAQNLLTPAYADWPDQPMFKTLLLIRENRFEDAAEGLAVARDRMDRLPKRYRAMILPGLLETAIVAEDWRAARDFALQFRKHADLVDSGAFHYLLGRAAQAGGDLVAAFDSYARAGEEHSLYGHRARTAVVSMALKHDVMKIQQARELLERETHLWRGDEYALAVLNDLAALDRADGDKVAAVYTYGSILDRFPEHRDAPLTRQKARALIGEIYADGASGDLPLSDFLMAHRKIAPDYRFEAGFDVQGEKFADRFLDAGSTLVAAQEYGQVHDYLAVARDLGLADVDDQRLDELRLKQASSLERGGQYDEALSVLREPLRSGLGDLDDERSEILARLYANTGQSGALLETAVAKPDIDFLRLKAEAYYDREDWAEAKEIYNDMWSRVGQELPFEDAIGLLLSAYRSEDFDLAMRLSEDFPELTGIPQWRTIAEGLMDPAAQLWPLREDTARMRMQSAMDALTTVDTVVPDTN